MNPDITHNCASQAYIQHPVQHSIEIMTTEDFLVAICFVIWTVIVIDWIQKMKTNIKEVNEYIHKQTNEVARLRELLNRAIELAKEAIRMADYDYENDKFGKVTLMKKELFELRQQIK